VEQARFKRAPAHQSEHFPKARSATTLRNAQRASNLPRAAFLQRVEHFSAVLQNRFSDVKVQMRHNRFERTSAGVR
jgi:hypothetical protein